LNGETNPMAALELLRTRRSVKADFLAEPGPDEDQLGTILEAGLRVPDHGKIGPWRIVHVTRGAGERVGDVIARRWLEDHPKQAPERAEPERTRLLRAPVVLCVVSAPDHDHKIPVWEQELSAGALCQNLLVAAHASGFAAQWLTGWIAYDRAVLEALGVGERERVAGYIHIGSPSVAPQERARPAVEERVTRLE
jgi:nitroreductase